MATQKPVHTIVLDTGAIIRNNPTVSTLIAQADTLVTVPAIITEIKDAATRSRVETTLQPFLTLRTPNPTSMKFVADFARKTGDLAVLSKPDLQIIALAYELECERNGGDWRLRKVPGQKGLNGSPPAKAEQTATSEAAGSAEPQAPEQQQQQDEEASSAPAVAPEQASVESKASSPQTAEHDTAQIEETLASTVLEDKPESALSAEPSTVDEDAEAEDSDDADGWITPSNLKKHQEKDANALSGAQDAPAPTIMQVGTLTTDFAMQNVLLQMNLNLLSPAMQRVKQVKTYVLRCHACFAVSREMSRQFCARCGKDTLTRVACSTNANTGAFTLHLKRNMQWNTRGDRFSIPKAVHGSSNTRRDHGGGKGGWGNELILAEDQKEYQRAVSVEKRRKERDLMDEDYLPSILTGDRSRQGGRLKVGAGRNVNSRKR